VLNDLANRALKAGIRVMGEPITLTRSSTVYSIKGVFQESFMSIDPRTGMPVNSAQPILGINSQDLSIEPKRGDLITARSVDYRIRDIQEDGHTGITLLLQRTSARD
tara:strand:+ start:1606 stop:1926 length:321 start_codon:yes stop_codon:yes gene_type:complete